MKHLHGNAAATSSFAILLTTLVLSGCDGSGGDGHAGHDDHGPPGASSNEVSLGRKVPTANASSKRVSSLADIVAWGAASPSMRGMAGPVGAALELVLWKAW